MTVIIGLDTSSAAALRRRGPPALSLSTFAAFDVGADMAGIFWAIHLYHKTVGIVELEALVIAARAGRDLKAVRGDLGAHRLGVPALQAEVVMIQRGAARLLLDAEEAFANRQDVDGLGMLRQLHAEKFLVEFGGLLQVGNPNRDVVEGDGLEAGCGQGRGGGQGD